jgi:hypothetical protein
LLKWIYYFPYFHGCICLSPLCVGFPEMYSVDLV